MAGAVAIPLNVATKEDLKQYAAKEDIKRIEDRLAAKEQSEAIAISVEESGRDVVQYLLEQRGRRCAAERLRLDAAGQSCGGPLWTSCFHGGGPSICT